MSLCVCVCSLVSYLVYEHTHTPSITINPIFCIYFYTSLLYSTLLFTQTPHKHRLYIFLPSVFLLLRSHFVPSPLLSLILSITSLIFYPCSKSRTLVSHLLLCFFLFIFPFDLLLCILHASLSRPLFSSAVCRSFSIFSPSLSVAFSLFHSSPSSPSSRFPLSLLPSSVSRLDEGDVNVRPRFKRGRRASEQTSVKPRVRIKGRFSLAPHEVPYQRGKSLK